MQQPDANSSDGEIQGLPTPEFSARLVENEAILEPQLVEEVEAVKAHMDEVLEFMSLPTPFVPKRRPLVPLISQDVLDDAARKSQEVLELERTSRVDDPKRKKMRKVLDQLTVCASDTMRLWSENYAVATDSTHSTKLKFDEITNDIKEMDAKSRSLPQSIPAVELRDQFKALAELAGDMLSPHDVAHLRSLPLSAMPVMDKLIAETREEMRPNSRISRFVSRRHGEFRSRMDSAENSTALLDGVIVSGDRLGTSLHRMLAAVARSEAIKDGMHLASILAQCSYELQSSPYRADPNRVEEVIGIECYLVEHADQLKRFLVKHSDDPDYRLGIEEAIRVLPKPRIAEAYERQQRLERLEAAKGFNQNVTDAKEVLRGGRRLGDESQKQRVQELADGLFKLQAPKSEEKLLSPEQSGVIVAIIIGQFDFFRQTVMTLKHGEPDLVLQTVRQERPEVCQEICDVRIDEVIFGIADALTNKTSGRGIRWLLSEQELRLLEPVIESYLDEYAVL